MRPFQTLWLAAAIAAVALSQQTPSFEVASVKPTGSGGRGGTKAGSSGSRDPTLFAVHNTTLKSLILRSYEIQDYQLSGGPAWIENDRYDIDARPEHPVANEQMMLMLRSLLADRFHLEIRRETKTLAVYVLTVAKGGPKFGPYFQRMKEGDPFPPDAGRLQLGGTLQNFASILRRNMQTFDPATGPVSPGTEIPPVLDHTGLIGEYSILVSYETREDWPSLLEHQLGLKMDLRKEPVEVVIVSRAEKPSGN